MRLLIDLEPADPRLGLAVDEAILESARDGGPDSLRLWRNDRAVVVGRSQSVREEVDVAFAASRGIPILRRISGGGTVLHHPGNLNISVALRDARRVGPTAEVFREFGTAVLEGIASVCPTASLDGSDLIVGAAKVGGAAQARRGGALLYHTTLLLWPDAIPMHAILLAMRSGYHALRVPSRPRRTGALLEAARATFPQELVGLLPPALARAAGGEALHVQPLSPSEARTAQRLAVEKYGDRKWNHSL